MLQNLKRFIKRIPWVWYNVRNRKYRAKPGHINDDLQEVVNGLKRYGIAKSDFQRIFPDIDWTRFYEEVYKAVAAYEKEGKIVEHADKDYMNFVLGLNPSYELDSLWAKIAGHSNLRAIAQSYFNMSRVDMRYYNIWKHEASSDEAKGSQLWHRDREDLKILKVFICLEDVDLAKGPFTYAPGTHMEGNVKQEPEYKSGNHGTHRTTDEMMNAVVIKEKWIKATGNKGSIVFADTNGYHKGGYVQEGYRLLFVAMYVSPASERFYFKHQLK